MCVCVCVCLFLSLACSLSLYPIGTQFHDTEMLSKANVVIAHLLLLCITIGVNTQDQVIIGLHDGNHDATAVASVNGTYRWIRLPCRFCNIYTLQAQISMLLKTLGDYNLDDVEQVVYSASNSEKQVLSTLKPHFSKLNNVGMMLLMQHHRLHALYGYHTSPFSSALIFTVDGCSMYIEQNFMAWIGTQGGKLVPVMTYGTCRIGLWYFVVHEWMLKGVRTSFNDLPLLARTHAPDPGYLKLCVQRIRNISRGGWWKPWQSLQKWIAAHPPNSKAKLSAVQTAAEQVLVAAAQDALRRVPAVQLDGVSFSGGVAVNPGLVAALSDAVRLPLWVPAAPGDESLSFAAGWSFRKPAHRPAVHFAKRSAVPQPPGPAQCTAARDGRLEELLAQGAAVGVVASGSEIHTNVPGHGTVFSCRPRDAQQIDVIMHDVLVPHYFVTAAPVRSPGHVFLLRTRPNGSLPIRYLRVAALERGQDGTVDGVLRAARACPSAPLLFAEPLAAQWSNARHVMWQDRYCALPAP